jgi:BASS family bile acid:Na+ symporter
MIKLLAGTSVDVSFFEMFLTLAKVIFIPFVLAQIIKKFAQRQILAIAPTFKPISVVLLGLLIAAVVSKQADPILAGLKDGQSWIYLGYLFGLFIVFHIVGYMTVFWRTHRDRITTTVCMAYMNFTLAIVLANEFFNEPEIVVPVVLSVLPWAILLSPFKWITSNVHTRAADDQTHPVS